MKMTPAIARLVSRLDEQGSQIEALRTSLATQFTRIAQVQAELDRPTWKRRPIGRGQLTAFPSHRVPSRLS